MENTNYVETVMTAGTNPTLVLTNDENNTYTIGGCGPREPDSYVRMTISVRKAAESLTKEDFELLTEVLYKFGSNSFEITESTLSKNSW